MSKTNPARGMRDFLPIDIRKREYVIQIIKEVYESYGFEPLETSAVENLETLTGKYGEEGNQLMFRILKRGEKLDVSSGEKGLSDLALRYDLTVPLARVVANYKNDLPKFFRRYQIQPVWRADRPARGRYREFYQCDVDAIGSKSMIVEAELISSVSEILQRLGFNDFTIRLNHRKVLTGFLSIHINESKHIDTLVALDKLDKIGVEGVYNELVNRGIEEETAEKLLEVFSALQQKSLTCENNEQLNEEILTAFENLFVNNDTGKVGLNELKSLLQFSKSKSSCEFIKLDPTLARGLSYYTGAIMEINVGKEIGSLGGGGRYDSLIGMFGKDEIPAVGFSLGLERILLIMEERGMLQKLIDEGKLKIDSADIMVTIWNEETIGESLKLANELRSQGLRVLVYPEADKLGKQFKYADSINIPFVCVLGESEIAENKVTLKNMQTGEQETIARNEIASKVKNQ